MDDAKNLAPSITRLAHLGDLKEMAHVQVTPVYDGRIVQPPLFFLGDYR